MSEKPPLSKNKKAPDELTNPEPLTVAVLSEDEIRRMIANAERKHFTDPTPEKTAFSQEEFLQNVEIGEIDFSTGEHLRKETTTNKEEDEEVSEDFKILTKEKFMFLLLQTICWTSTTRGITNSPYDKFDLGFINKTAEESKDKLVKIAGFYLHDVQLKYIADEVYKVLETQKNIFTPFAYPIKTFFEKVFHYVPQGLLAWKEGDPSQ